MPLTIDTVAALLKNETAAQHQEAEDVLQAYLASVDSTEKYAALLRAFYSYFHPLQEVIATYISTAILHDMDQRRTAASILDDLRFLNAPLPFTLCNKLPAIRSREAAFGALYVMEGSTLGGRVIAKMMLKKMPHLEAGGLSFFSGYGEQTGARWKYFLEVLNSQEGSDAMVAAADETFAMLTAWLQHNLVHE